MADFTHNRLAALHIGNKSPVFPVGGKRQKELGNPSKSELIGGQPMFTLDNNTSDHVFDFHVNFQIRLSVVPCTTPRSVAHVPVQSPITW